MELKNEYICSNCRGSLRSNRNNSLANTLCPKCLTGKLILKKRIERNPDLNIIYDGKFVNISRDNKNHYFSLLLTTYAIPNRLWSRIKEELEEIASL